MGMYKTVVHEMFPSLPESDLHGSPSSDLMQPLLDSVSKETGAPAVFSMQCCGWNTSSAGKGELVIGGTDRSLYAGELQYTPIVLESLLFVNVTSIGATGSAMVA